MKNYVVRYRESEHGFIGYIEDLPGVTLTGGSLNSLREDAIDALRSSKRLGYFDRPVRQMIVQWDDEEPDPELAVRRALGLPTA